MRLFPAISRSPLLACTALCVVGLVLASCGRTPPPTPAPQPVAVTQWMAEDADAVVATLADAMLKHPWSSQFRDKSGRVPSVHLDRIDDRSGDRVDTAGFAAALAKLLAASSKVQVASSASGADFAITGAIGMKPDAKAPASDPAKFYSIDLILRDAAGATQVPFPTERRVGTRMVLMPTATAPAMKEPTTAPRAPTR